MIRIDSTYRINEVLSYIHRDISADLSAKKLATLASYSEQHFHRLFKTVTGEGVHQYIRRTRLETAANQLMFSAERNILTVAEACGFVSLSSFSRAFKSVYSVTPGEWRSGGSTRDTCDSLNDPEINAAYQRIQPKILPKPDIVMLAPRKVAYVRHKGYGRSISNAWQVLKTWAISEQRPMNIQIGLHHSNPALVPLDQCRYVACVEIDKPIVRRGHVNSVTIPGGPHAAFTIKGQYGDLLPYIHKILEQWLPASPFTAKTTPAFAVYHKNQFLLQEDDFELTFFLPVSLY
ncbi:MAG: AraC family transcriptional regulator [Candidatus Endobugula sp.]|jgi:AraC family transcriptional regulator